MPQSPFVSTIRWVRGARVGLPLLFPVASGMLFRINGLACMLDRSTQKTLPHVATSEDFKMDTSVVVSGILISRTLSSVCNPR